MKDTPTPRLKYWVLEFGRCGGMHTDNATFKSWRLAANMAERISAAFANCRVMPLDNWRRCKRGGPANRVEWTNGEYYVALTRIHEGDTPGPASEYLWKGNTGGISAYAWKGETE